MVEPKIQYEKFVKSFEIHGAAAVHYLFLSRDKPVKYMTVVNIQYLARRGRRIVRCKTKISVRARTHNNLLLLWLNFSLKKINSHP